MGDSMISTGGARKLTARERLILALDVPTLDEAITLIRELKDSVGMFKVGLELYTNSGSKLFEWMRAEGVPFFFDCKFLDIPNTVARASESLVCHGIEMFNVHSVGGSVMMKTTADAVKAKARTLGVDPPKLLAVTILTSIGDEILKNEIGSTLSTHELVPKLAKLAKDAGLDGVVASARETESIKQTCGPDFLTVTPGIRPTWADCQDQVRTVSPKEAVQCGSDYIVIGRPITQADNRRDAARRIVAEMEGN